MAGITRMYKAQKPTAPARAIPAAIAVPTEMSSRSTSNAIATSKQARPGI